VVHSVFARAVNLRIGDELWTLLGHEGNDAALTIRLAPGQDLGAVARRVGEPVHVRSGHVGVGSSVIDCRTAQRWTPQPYGPAAPGIPARASALELDARRHAWAGSWQLAWDVTAALGSPCLRTRERLDDVVRHTVGRGPGLTPAGDDVLVGVLAVLTSPAADPASAVLVERLRSALQPTLASTTDVSSALLEQAASGHPSRAVWDLVRGLLTGRAADDVTGLAGACARHGRDLRGRHLRRNRGRKPSDVPFARRDRRMSTSSRYYPNLYKDSVSLMTVSAQVMGITASRTPRW